MGLIFCSFHLQKSDKLFQTHVAEKKIKLQMS